MSYYSSGSGSSKNMKFKQLNLVHLTIILCLSVFAFSTRSTASQKDGLLKVYFFDIGQGDSIFIEAPNGNQVLVDGGPDGKVLEKLGEVMPFYDKDIDMVILSHPHTDHFVGLIDVLARYEVKNIIEAKEENNSPQFKLWQQAVEYEGANNIEAIAGYTIDLGNDVFLKILHPFVSVAGTKPSNPHDDVVVAMLQYGSTRILLTGDMEAKVEDKLILSGSDIDADVLKVGHHGSNTSSKDNFIKVVTPQLAVIQVGAKNKYGLPSPEVLKRLEGFGIKYYRNDLDGDIKLTSDGQSFQITKN